VRRSFFGERRWEESLPRYGSLRKVRVVPQVVTGRCLELALEVDGAPELAFLVIEDRPSRLEVEDGDRRVDSALCSLDVLGNPVHVSPPFISRAHSGQTFVLPPEHPSNGGALVRSPRNELHALDVESLSPVRLVFENRLEHRLGLGRRVEELNDLMDLVRNDGVEDHGARIRRRRREFFDLLGVRSTPAERLANPEAVLSRSDLRELGYERRAVDAIFRSCPVVSLPGYSRPLIRVADYLAFLEHHTYDGRTNVR
jgi:hypothetical protein